VIRFSGVDKEVLRKIADKAETYADTLSHALETAMFLKGEERITSTVVREAIRIAKGESKPQDLVPQLEPCGERKTISSLKFAWIPGDEAMKGYPFPWGRIRDITEESDVFSWKDHKEVWSFLRGEKTHRGAYFILHSARRAPQCFAYPDFEEIFQEYLEYLQSGSKKQVIVIVSDYEGMRGVHFNHSSVHRGVMKMRPSLERFYGK